MKKILIVVIFYLSGGCWAQGIQEITVVSDEWCPYTCEVGSKAEGFGVDIARAIYEPLGIRVVYLQLPWDEALKLVKDGQYNAVIGAYKTDSEYLLYPSTPFATSYNCFYTKATNKWQYTGIKSLTNQMIGAVKGYTYGNNLDLFFDTNLQTHIYKASGIKALNQLFLALENDRITTIIEDRYVFGYTRKNNFEDIPTKLAGCQLPANTYIAFSPSHPDSAKLMEIFDHGMKRLKNTKEYQKILNNYGAKP